MLTLSVHKKHTCAVNFCPHMPFSRQHRCFCVGVCLSVGVGVSVWYAASHQAIQLSQLDPGSVHGPMQMYLSHQPHICVCTFIHTYIYFSAQMFHLVSAYTQTSAIPQCPLHSF